MAAPNAELQELVRKPREALDIEVKDWLDLASNEHRALLAKEIIALANHGGGFVVVGFSEDDAGQFHPSAGRPDNLKSWSQDSIQSIVSKYIEPAFQCRVEHIDQAEGLPHPLIVVPGGHRIPIKAKSGSPDGKKLVTHRVYVRRSGPASEEPQSSAEWDQLLERCLRNRQTDLLAGIRDLLAGVVPTVAAPAPIKDDLAEFIQASEDRWAELVAPLPSDSTARFPLGSYEVALQIQGGFDKLSLKAMRSVLDIALKNHSGWPPFLVINRPPYEPRPVNGAIETWLGPSPDGRVDRASHSDFWRISPDGLFYTRRGFNEDDGNRGIKPGSAFNISTPIWRLGEAIVQVAYVARAMNAVDANLAGDFRWRGLAGRELVSIESPSALSIKRFCHQDSFRITNAISLGSIPDALPEIVFEVLEPLYQLFDFFQLPKRLVESELRKLLAHSF